MPNQIFTDGADTYTVSTAGDYWLGFLGGNDTLTVDGGTSTTALMGEGNDVVKLESGLAIVVYGESGADLFDVWAADATAYGGGGNDRFNLRGGSSQFLYGDAGADRFYFYFNGVDVMLDGGSGNDLFYGNNRTISGNIHGGAGNDSFFTFNGGGALLLYGGSGNDTYRADPVTPAGFVENASEGTDTVQVSRGISYTLPANIERILVGNYAGSTDAAATLSGNAIANTIIAAGNADTLYGLDGNDRLYGKDGNDALYGGKGADILDGGTGDDLMFGGLGGDTYYVGSLLDQVNENAGEGIDTVRLSVSGYTLPDNVERGIIASWGYFTLHGNAIDNILTGAGSYDTLYGYGGNDILDGIAGITQSIDTLYGGAGDDIYYVDYYQLNGEFEAPPERFDGVIENPGEGVDTVYVALGEPELDTDDSEYTLPDHVENGYLLEHSPVGWFTPSYSLFGNGLDNVLVGSSGDDQLFGEAGNDTLQGGQGLDILSGGAGDDVFVYRSSSESSAIDSDTILDFTSLDGEGSDDQIDLSGIDADVTTPGDQAFTLNETGGPYGAGDLWYAVSNVNGDGTFDITLYGDTDGDGIADFELLVKTATTSFYFDDIIW